MPELKGFTLGSGNLYVMAYSGSMPANTSIEVAANLIGEIKGGASIEYKFSTIDIEDDNFQRVASFIGKEEVTLKSGVMKWNLDNLAQLSSGALLDDAVTGVRTLKIGGLGARELDKYVVHFVHTKADGKKIRATMLATSSNGFTLAFEPDKQTIVDAEFKAMASDAAGTQLIYSIEYEVE
jgi:hypothetical protein